ncbi:MAG: Lacal_2735 family protein [Salibacteraceae bacterium]
MFEFFKKKSAAEKLKDQYAKLMQESFQLSSSNRKLADAKLAEAEVIGLKIQELKNQDEH